MRRVLIVDDSRAIRLAMGRSMAELGFQVSEAADATDGLSLLQRGETFDLLLVDLLMPGLDGIEFIRRVRSNPTTQHTPIIMVSAVSGQNRLVEAIEAGANEYIVKPFTKEILAMKLDLIGVEHG